MERRLRKLLDQPTSEKYSFVGHQLRQIGSRAHVHWGRAKQSYQAVFQQRAKSGLGTRLILEVRNSEIGSVQFGNSKCATLNLEVYNV